jgi:hypothetical protein
VIENRKYKIRRWSIVYESLIKVQSEEEFLLGSFFNFFDILLRSSFLGHPVGSGEHFLVFPGFSDLGEGSTSNSNPEHDSEPVSSLAVHFFLLINTIAL